MGMTSDIGQANIEAVQEVFDARGASDADWWDAFGWCYPHDNNTLVGLCTCCEKDQRTVDAEHGGSWIAAFRAAAEQWLDD